jgi:hypothetical protein
MSALYQVSSGHAVPLSGIQSVSPLFAIHRTRKLNVLAGVGHQSPEPAIILETSTSLQVSWLLTDTSGTTVVVGENEIRLVSSQEPLLESGAFAKLSEEARAQVMVHIQTLYKYHSASHALASPIPVPAIPGAPVHTAEDLARRVTNRTEHLTSYLDTAGLLKEQHKSDIQELSDARELLASRGVTLTSSDVSSILEFPILNIYGSTTSTYEFSGSSFRGNDSADYYGAEQELPNPLHINDEEETAAVEVDIDDV